MYMVYMGVYTAPTQPWSDGGVYMVYIGTDVIEGAQGVHGVHGRVHSSHPTLVRWWGVHGVHVMSPRVHCVQNCVLDSHVHL